MTSHRFFLSGGLGNTLFQIARISEISKKHDVKIIKAIYQDTLLTRILGWSVHSELISFNKTKEHKCKFIDFLVLLLLFLKRKISPSRDASIRLFNIIWHFGYYQSEVNWENIFIKKTIPSYINFSPDYTMIGSDDILLSNSCIVHVRKGDFSDNMTVENTYYLKILQNLKSKFEYFVLIGVEASSVLEYIKSNGINNVILAKKNEEKYDYNLMFFCKNVVVSNSTFCFWPVILGVEKTVYLSSTKAHWPFKLLYKSFSNIKLIEIE